MSIFTMTAEDYKYASEAEERRKQEEVAKRFVLRAFKRKGSDKLTVDEMSVEIHCLKTHELVPAVLALKTEGVLEYLEGEKRGGFPLWRLRSDAEIAEAAQPAHGEAEGVETPSADPQAPYITLIKGVGGWNSCLMAWDEDCNCHTPWQTGSNNTSAGTGSWQGAEREGKDWAISEEIEFRTVDPASRP
jgi:hypothetical protein